MARVSRYARKTLCHLRVPLSCAAGIAVESVTKFRNLVMTRGTVRAWSAALNTRFNLWRHESYCLDSFLYVMFIGILCFTALSPAYCSAAATSWSRASRTLCPRTSLRRWTSSSVWFFPEYGLSLSALFLFMRSLIFEQASLASLACTTPSASWYFPPPFMMAADS